MASRRREELALGCASPCLDRYWCYEDDFEGGFEGVEEGDDSVRGPLVVASLPFVLSPSLDVAFL
jgi:hypothetical protein